MALINTDWTKELEQVERSLQKVLQNDLEPMVNRTLDRSVNEVEVALNKASFEIQEAIKQLGIETDRQRQLLMSDIKRIIVFLFGGIGTLITLFFLMTRVF